VWCRPDTNPFRWPDLSISPSQSWAVFVFLSSNQSLSDVRLRRLPDRVHFHSHNFDATLSLASLLWLEHAYYAGDRFASFPAAAVYEMNGSTIACASAGIEPARSLTLPEPPNHRRSCTRLGPLQRETLPAASRMCTSRGLDSRYPRYCLWFETKLPLLVRLDPPLGNWSLWPVSSAICSPIHFLRASLIARFSISTHRGRDRPISLAVNNPGQSAVMLPSQSSAGKRKHLAV